jgi:hypothetical protein
MKIKNIIQIRKSENSNKIKKQAFESGEYKIQESISADEWLKLLLPLNTIKKAIEEIRVASRTSVAGILNIITGTDQSMQNINSGILKTAFSRGAAFALGGQSGYDYDYSAGNFMGPPDNDQTISRTRELLYGQSRSLSPSTIRNMLNNKDKEKRTRYKEIILSKLPAMPAPGQDNPLTRSIKGVYGANAADVITKLYETDENKKIENWLSFISDVSSKKITAEESFKEFKENPPKRPEDSNKHRVTEEELDEYNARIIEEGGILSAEVQNWSKLQNDTLKYFSVSPAAGVSMQEPTSGKGGFLYWDGNIELFNEYLNLFGTISKANFYVDSQIQQRSKNQKEMERIESIPMSANEKEARKAELKQSNLFCQGIIDSYSKISTDQSAANTFNEVFCKDILSIIETKIKPKLLEITKVNELNITPIVNKLNGLFDIVVSQLSNAKTRNYKVIDSYEKTFRSYNSELSKVFVNTPRVLILNNFDKNSRICKKKDQNNQSKEDVARAQTENNGSLSGTDGDFVTVPELGGVLDEYHKMINVRNSDEIKKKGGIVPKTMVIVTSQKVDFKHLPQRGPGGVSYIDLRQLLSVNDEIADSLIKYLVRASASRRIKLSSVEVMKDYLIGRSITSVVEIIRESLVRCEKSTVQVKGKRVIDPKCIVNICDEISFATAASISPLLQRRKTDIPPEEYVVSSKNENYTFVHEHLDRAKNYKQDQLIYLQTLDKIEDLQDESDKLTEILNRSKDLTPEEKKQIQDEIARISNEISLLTKEREEIKIDMDKFGIRLEEDHNFYILYGPSATGKSIFPRVLARQLGWTFYQVNLSNAKNMFVGESERKLREFMEAVLRLRNVIINFDEMDGQAFTPIKGGGTSADQLQTTMRTALQSFFEDHEEEFKARNIIFFGSTNNLENIATAIRSRTTTQEWENPINEDTIVDVIKSGLGKIKRTIDVEHAKNDEGEPTSMQQYEAAKWKVLEEKLLSLGTETLRQGGMLLTGGKGIDYRQFIGIMQKILSLDKQKTKMELVRQEFINDKTPDKQMWSAKYTIFAEDWKKAGSPQDDPFPLRLFFGKELNKDTFLKMCEKKTKKSVGQDSGAEFETEIYGTDLTVKADMVARAKQKGIITSEQDESEEEKDQLGLFDENKEDMATPAVGAVESVQGVEAAPTGQKTDDVIDEDENKNFISIPSETEKVQPPAQKQKKKQKPGEEVVQSSTDYFYNFLKKHGVIQPIVQPSVNTVKNAETTMKDRRDLFNIHRYKFVPNF